MDNSKKLARQKDLSEKIGIEMIVIDEAEKIIKTGASRFVRGLMLSTGSLAKCRLENKFSSAHRYPASVPAEESR